MIIFVYDGIGPIGQDSNVVSLQILGIAEVHPIFGEARDTNNRAGVFSAKPKIVKTTKRTDKKHCLLSVEHVLYLK